MSLENTPAARISALAAAQKTYFRSGATLSEAFRRTMLRRLDAALANWEKRLCDALWTDLHKSPEEAYLTEISIVRGEIRSHLRHLGRWMRPAPRPTPLKLLPAKSRIVSQPLGQALIVAPWNYPVQLLLNPLVGAISAGCTALLKPSPYTPNVAEALEGMIAEIFDEEIRARICPDKGSTAEWLAVHEAAHRLGIKTNATILYGHIEGVEHRIDHLDRLRALQDRTGGFNAFIPLKYRNYGNAMSEVGEVSVIEDLRMLAMSRIYLDNIPHVKAYWVMYGKATTELALAFGADDIDGTIDDTTKIYSMAGADDRRPRMTADEMRTIVRHAGLRAVERDTLYNEL